MVDLLEFRSEGLLPNGRVNHRDKPGAVKSAMGDYYALESLWQAEQKLFPVKSK